jgi:hypothetical protein
MYGEAVWPSTELDTRKSIQYNGATIELVERQRTGRVAGSEAKERNRHRLKAVLVEL